MASEDLIVVRKPSGEPIGSFTPERVADIVTGREQVPEDVKRQFEEAAGRGERISGPPTPFEERTGPTLSTGRPLSQAELERREQERRVELVKGGAVPVSPAFAEKAGIITKEERGRAEQEGAFFFVKTEEKQGVTVERRSGVTPPSIKPPLFTRGEQATVSFKTGVTEKDEMILVPEKSAQEIILASQTRALPKPVEEFIGGVAVTASPISVGAGLIQLGEELKKGASPKEIGKGVVEGLKETGKGVVKGEPFAVGSAIGLIAPLGVGKFGIGKIVKPSAFETTVIVGQTVQRGVRLAGSELKLVRVDKPVVERFISKGRPEIIFPEAVKFKIGTQKIFEGEGRRVLSAEIGTGMAEASKIPKIERLQKVIVESEAKTPRAGKIGIEKTIIAFERIVPAIERTTQKPFMILKPSAITKTPYEVSGQPVKAVSAASAARAELFRLGRKSGVTTVKSGTPEIIQIRGMIPAKIRPIRESFDIPIVRPPIERESQVLGPDIRFDMGVVSLPLQAQIQGVGRRLISIQKSALDTQRKTSVAQAIGERLAQTPKLAQSVAVKPKELTMLKSVPRQLSPRDVFRPPFRPKARGGFPLGIPFRLPSLSQKLFKGGISLSFKRAFKYQPSLAALGLNIKAPKISRTTGLELRPLIGGVKLRKKKGRR